MRASQICSHFLTFSVAAAATGANPSSTTMPSAMGYISIRFIVCCSFVSYVCVFEWTCLEAPHAKWAVISTGRAPRVRPGPTQTRDALSCRR